MHVSELHYLCSISILNQVFKEGILSLNSRRNPTRDQKPLNGPQISRDQQSVDVHTYAILHFNGRNPQLYAQKNDCAHLCVLRIYSEVTQEEGVLVADRNSAAKDVCFKTVEEGLKILKWRFIFGEYWTDVRDTEEQKRLKGQYRSAELLVPFQVPPHFIGGVIVPNETARDSCLQICEGAGLEVEVNPYFFFLQRQKIELIALRNLKRSECEGVVKTGASESKKIREEIVLDSTSDSGGATASTAMPPEEINSSLTLNPISKEEIRSSNIQFLKGQNLLLSRLQTLVNTVNCVGVMGKGIALEFKKRYPEMFQDYAKKCARKEVQLGEPYLYRESFFRFIVNFPTKGHWQEKSQLESIEKGLQSLVEHVEEWKITSLAIPPLGCGNGGLDWTVVKPLMFRSLSQLSIPVDIYEP